MPLNYQDERKWQHVKVLELSLQGLTYTEISEKIGCSTGKISGIIHEINLKAKTEIKAWLDEVVPLEYKKSLLLNQYIGKKAMELAENTKDERVKCQALNLLQENDQKKRDLLSDSHVINEALGFIENQKTKQEIANISADKPNSRSTKSNSDSSTTDNDQEEVISNE
jgi:hypothetical protein